jgi:hypothetical protein
VLDDFFDKYLKNEMHALCVLQVCFIDKYYPDSFYSIMEKALKVQDMPTIERRDIWLKKMADLKATRSDWLENEYMKQLNDEEQRLKELDNE